MTLFNIQSFCRVSPRLLGYLLYLISFLPPEVQDSSKHFLNEQRDAKSGVTPLRETMQYIVTALRLNLCVVVQGFPWESGTQLSLGSLALLASLLQ